jgi:hypothetical protein
MPTDTRRPALALGSAATPSRALSRSVRPYRRPPDPLSTMVFFSFLLLIVFRFSQRFLVAGMLAGATSE